MSFLVRACTEKIRPEVSHLYVQLKGLHGLLQHRGLLLLRQLDAVHPTPVQLLETVGAADTGEVEEGKPLFAAQTERFLGNLSQHLSPREITEVASVGVGH